MKFTKYTETSHRINATREWTVTIWLSCYNIRYECDRMDTLLADTVTKRNLMTALRSMCRFLSSDDNNRSPSEYLRQVKDTTTWGGLSVVRCNIGSPVWLQIISLHVITPAKFFTYICLSSYGSTALYYKMQKNKVISSLNKCSIENVLNWSPSCFVTAAVLPDVLSTAKSGTTFRRSSWVALARCALHFAVEKVSSSSRKARCMETNIIQHINTIVMYSGDQLWWSIPSGSLPLCYYIFKIIIVCYCGK